ncbi:MAG: MarR family winged helix-turn-helix transcriptional regulator [Sulfobacillus sp.]
MDSLSAKDATDKLVSIQHLFRVMMERRPRGTERRLTRLQRFLLVAIARQGPLTMSELARLLDVGQTTISQFVGTLESQGWITRAFDPLDRRRHLVAITETGQELVHSIQSSQHRYVERILEQLSAQERAQLVAIAEHVATILADAPDLLKEDSGL